jgi:hypothetical protein
MIDKEYPMMKKLAAAVALLCVAALVFAQSEPKKVLSAKDVDGFITNYATIEADLDALGDKYAEFFNADTSSEEDDISKMIANTRALKVPDEIQAILKKDGLGDNGFEKFMVITFGFYAIYMEMNLDAEAFLSSEDPEMKAIYDEYMAMVNNMKDAIHKDDLKVIEARKDDLLALLASE